MLAYQIEQLKEDITGKETGLKTCEASLNKCHKKTEQLRNEIQLDQTKLSEARADISALRQEEARLNRIVNVSDMHLYVLRSFPFGAFFYFGKGSIIL